MKKALERLFRRRPLGAPVAPAKDAHAEFSLLYTTVPVATLKMDGDEWTFRYSDEIRSGEPLIRPLPEFPDVWKTYRSKNLWAFFSTRIPSLKRDAIQEIVRTESLPTDQVALLRRFGRKTVANPFELVEGPLAMAH